MARRLELLGLLALLGLVSGLTESDQWCFHDNPGTLDNSFLLGTWYEVYWFAPADLDIPSSSFCSAINITRPTAADLARYSSVYGSKEPLKIDDTAVLYDRYVEKRKGILTGGSQVKFFAWDPTSVFFNTSEYVSYAYRKISDDYVLFNSCTVYVHKFLWSRRRDQTAEELRSIISTIKEVERMESQRYCH